MATTLSTGILLPDNNDYVTRANERSNLQTISDKIIEGENNLVAHLAASATQAHKISNIEGLTTALENKGKTYTLTLDTSWPGSSAPFTKTEEVSGILATDNPIVDVQMSGTLATDDARQEAWGLIYRITTDNDSITLYAKEIPTVSLPLQLKVVR